MSNTLNAKIIDPYATALFQLAKNKNILDGVTSDINDLLEMLDENKTLLECLTCPAYTDTVKSKILDETLKKLSFNENTVKFLMVLQERGRFDCVEAIAGKFLEFVYEFANIKIVQVSSAVPLTIEQEEELINNLVTTTGAEEIKLITSVDKTLLGGLKVQIDSNVIDLTLKAELDNLKAQNTLDIY